MRSSYVERGRKCDSVGMRVTKWKMTFGRVYKRGGEGKKTVSGEGTLLRKEEEADIL